MDRIEEMKQLLAARPSFAGIEIKTEEVSKEADTPYTWMDSTRLRITVGQREVFVFGRNDKDSVGKMTWVYFVTVYAVTGEPVAMGHWAQYEAKEELVKQIEAAVDVARLVSQSSTGETPE